ncbi:MAG: adenylate/guanylate cyclase domain-containing protein [Gammaproteobacteria bacterium]|nr:adenylate/guanylate cyclase domain-containing protein [Gammaproteobacteria bacterium]
MQAWISQWRRQLTRIGISLAIILFFLTHLVGWVDVSLIRQLEALTYDARLNLTLPETVDKRIVIIDIDEASLAAEGRWPWDRDKLRKLVDVLFDHYQIRVLGFDVVFAEKDENPILKQLEGLIADPAYQALTPALERIRPLLDHDKVFAEGLQGRPVVLGYYFNQDSSRSVSSGALPLPVFPAGSFPKNSLSFKSASSYGGNIPVLQQAAAAGGFFDNPTTSIDGVFRRVPMLQEYQGAVYESLSLAVARLYLRQPVRAIFAKGFGIGKNYNGMEWIGLGQHKIPVDADAATLVPYRGRQGSFPYVSATQVLNQTVPGDVKLKGTIALIGTTAPGLLDLRNTPVQKIYPGVEIHANLVSAILDDRFQHRPAYTLGAELVILVVIGLMLALILPLLNSVWSTLFAFTVFAVTVILNLMVWQYSNFVLPLASPLLLIMVLFMHNTSYGYFVESRSKRQLGGLFGQYVPPELVEEMSKDPQRYSLQGERREMTVLFSDVRGFTTISEGLNPEELSDLMNAFLTPMTEVIHQYRGTIDKYMGDAIMAFWGAPLNNPDHARFALEAAMAMDARLQEIQEQFAERGWPPIKVGIGLNTGEMNVGNMGSAFRMAYTVLGDAVNLGSRLEGLTKQYGVTIIVSEYTRNAVADFVYRELDRVRVKGKDKPVVIYEPIGKQSELSQEVLDELILYRNGLEHYRAQRWDQAELQFLNLQKAYPQRLIYKVYCDRISHFHVQPPGTQWDGVYTHTTK